MKLAGVLLCAVNQSTQIRWLVMIVNAPMTIAVLPLLGMVVMTLTISMRVAKMALFCNGNTTVKHAVLEIHTILVVTINAGVVPLLPLLPPLYHLSNWHLVITIAIIYFQVYKTWISADCLSKWKTQCTLHATI